MPDEKKGSDLLVNDKFIRLVVGKWKLRPVVLWIFSSIIPFIFFGILALILGDFRSHGDTIGFIDDFGFNIYFLIGIPLTITSYVFTPVYLQQCISALIENGVLGDPKIESDAIGTMEKAKKSLSHWSLKVSSFVLSAGFIAFAIPIHLQSKEWVTRNIISLIFVEATWLLLFGLAILFVLRIIVGIWWLNQFFRTHKVIVRPLYPDGVGGLQPLSKYSMKLANIIFFIGILLGANQFQTAYAYSGEFGTLYWGTELVIVWIVYLIIAPIAFFAPIGAAHDVMSLAKKNELMNISKQFEIDYQTLRTNLNQEVGVVDKHIGKIMKLRELYSIIKSFPVWPFQIEKLAQFAATVALPILLTAASTFVATLIGNILK